MMSANAATYCYTEVSDLIRDQNHDDTLQYGSCGGLVLLWLGG